MLEIFLLDEILKILPGKPHSLDSSDVIKEINKKKKKKNGNYLNWVGNTVNSVYICQIFSISEWIMESPLRSWGEELYNLKDKTSNNSVLKKRETWFRFNGMLSLY